MAAMFPNATKGYMPFVHGKNPATQTKHKRSKPHVNGGKLHQHYKTENNQKTLNGAVQKMYQITLQDKKGNTYKYIVTTDGSKSLPELCETKINSMKTHNSMPNIGRSSPSKQRKILAEKLEALNTLNESSESFTASLDLRNCGKKEGLFSTFIRFIKEKTSKSEKKSKSHKSSAKSKRKPRDLSQRKRQRTVSAMSNLDPIQESPNEHEYEDDDDNDSYTHYNSSFSSDSDSSSVASSVDCSIEAVEKTS